MGIVFLILDMMYAIFTRVHPYFKTYEKKHILSDMGERNGEVTGGNTENS